MKSASQIADAAVEMAAARSAEPLRVSFGLGVAAGAFIALAGMAMLSFAKATGDLPAGAVSLISGLVFCTGLALVFCAGGELFTGNCLMPIGWTARRAGVWPVIRNWIVVYAGNAVGALIVLGLVLGSGLLVQGGALTDLGTKALAVARGKVGLSFGAAFFRGVLCNWLVVLAVWVGMGCDSVTDKIVGLLLPITAFVMSGYEHCVANMFFLPAGLAAQQLSGGTGLTVSGLFSNLVPVTLGNLVGGMVFVAFLYGWTFHPGRRAENR